MSTRQSYINRQPSTRQSYINRQPSTRQSYINRQPSTRQSYINRQPSTGQSYINRQPSTRQSYINRQLSTRQSYINRQLSPRKAYKLVTVNQITTGQSYKYTTQSTRLVNQINRQLDNQTTTQPDDHTISVNCRTRQLLANSHSYNDQTSKSKKYPWCAGDWRG